MAKRRGRRRDPSKRDRPARSRPTHFDFGASNPPRSEDEIFRDLEDLCASVGYVHALSFLIYRDTVVTFGEELKKGDLEKLYQHDRLIRTEIVTLIGCWLKSDQVLDHPGSAKVQEMINRSEFLLAELHASMIAPAHADFMAVLERRAFETGAALESPLGKAAAMREAIFYASESAFSFQYPELAQKRYRDDAPWLEANKGFNIGEAVAFFQALFDWLSDQMPKRIESLREVHPNEWTMLPQFCFSFEEAIELSSLAPPKIERILEAFTAPASKNTAFRTINSFNDASVYPIVRLSNGKFVLFQEYVASESVYASPAFWMRRDQEYAPTSSANRGRFAERETRSFLDRVFRAGQVFQNVIFKRSKGTTAGEADIIVVWGRRAFVFQVKSKGLTEVARTGDELAVSRDFKGAIQDAYNQAVVCIDQLRKGTPAYVDGDLIDLSAVKYVKEFIPICVTSENYPSLSFQVAQFLKSTSDGSCKEPIILDLFTLDIITEFLRSPLYFVDYISKRSGTFQKVIASHEINILGLHLRNNLHVDSDVNLMMLDDDFAMELDLALSVRRRGLPGNDTPSGLLTRELNNPLGRILSDVEKSDRPEVHLLGELILALSSDAWDTANRWITKILKQSREDGESHDVTIPLDEGGTGLTVHCNTLADKEASQKLASHCELRKYVHKANSWYGICLHPVSEEVRFAVGRLGQWAMVPELEEEARKLKVRSASHWIDAAGSRRKKVGVNEPCPCGSGVKYKKCCRNI